MSELIAAAEEVGLGYGVVGGYAVATWGIPRATYDVDLLVEPSAEELAGFFDACADRGSIRIPGRERELRVISAADLVLLKLLADRPKDRIDVQNVLSVQGVPEREHLFEWARRLGVTDRLERALQEAGLAEHP